MTTGSTSSHSAAHRTELDTALADRYRLERELGAGGMATVWLAEDVRHRRRVAIKVLHPELSAVLGPERFLKEIELTASLQHPHILPLFDSGEAAGQLYYVMPLVDGDTLRARLDRERQLPVGDALRIASQVADELAYAHARGVVHRDIKPENILLQGGHALVADFGIALAVSNAGGERLTQTGISLGTPQYMAPEQALGERQTDARADVYALGAVTYEMLAGEPPFTGPTAQAIVARVLTEPPCPLAAQRPSVPPHVDAAVRAALAKLPADRFATVTEFAAALAGTAPAPATTRTGARVVSDAAAAPWRVAALGAAAIALTAVGVAAWAWRRAAAMPEARVVQFRMDVRRRDLTDSPPRFALSRDGRTILYQMPGVDSGALAVRHLDRLDATPVPGTGGVTGQTFSPDGQSIAFLTRSGDVRVVPAAGGQPVTVARGADELGCVDWADDGFLYFVLRDAMVVARVPATGGAVDTLGTPEVSAAPRGFRQQRCPVVAPGGRVVLFNTYRGPNTEGDIGVLDLATRRSRYVAKGVRALGIAWGHLLVTTGDGELRAYPFDERRLAVTGAPTTLLSNVDIGHESNSQIALARDGTLAYSPTVPAASLVWVDRAGVETPVDSALRRPFDGLALSPQGDRLAFSVAEPDGASSVWIYGFAERTITRFTTDSAFSYRPSWTPDGASIVFASDRGSATKVRNLWIRPADGGDTARLLVAAERRGQEVRSAQEVSWSRGSPLVVYRVGYDDGKDYRDLRWFPPGADTTTHPLVATSADELNPALSPDGRWLAYVSNESGRDEVYVRPFPGPAGRVQISSAGGTGPLWAHSGRELFYRSGDNRMTAVTVAPRGDRFAFTQRRALFDMAPYRDDRQHPPYDIAPDDRRFLLISVPRASEVDVVVGWGSEARRRLGQSP